MSLCLYRHRVSPSLDKKSVSLHQPKTTIIIITTTTIMYCTEENRKIQNTQNVLTSIQKKWGGGDSCTLNTRRFKYLISNYKVSTHSHLAG
jgi:hypothetical protein